MLKEAGLTPAEIGKLQEMPWKEYLRHRHEGAAEARGRDGRQLARRHARADSARSSTARSCRSTRTLPTAAPTAAQRADDHLLDVQRAVAELGGLVAREHHAATRWSRRLKAAGRVRRRVRRQGAGGRGGLRQGVPGQEAGGDLVAGRAATGRAWWRWPTPRSKQPAPVFVTWFGWQPPLFDSRIARVPLRGHLLLVLQHGPDADHTGGGAQAAEALRRRWPAHLLQFMKTGDPNGNGLTPWPQIHDGQGRDDGSRRRVRGEERSGPGGAEGAAGFVTA